MSSNGEACEYLKKAVLQAIGSKFPAAGDLQYEVIIEKPKQKSFGDLSTPVAMSIAKKMHANPANVAREIMSAFVWDDSFVEPDENLDSTITGGFINFKLSRSYLNRMLRLVNDDPQNFGKVKSGHPKKILFEFVSANPTGPMVVVNGRAAAIGDVMARVNEWLGNDVMREFYVNDYGHQVELLGKSIACRYFEEKGE
ncbi:MAG TPA: arginine--tRNA ligase, partial [Fibrobacteres bacterium]|nr:arginine--tRNA ligase [Fibrobacterota bacterium]